MRREHEGRACATASNVATGRLRMRACAIRAIMAGWLAIRAWQIARGEMRRGFFEDDVWRRLAKVGGEIAEQELGQRAGAKGGEAEAALDQPDDIKARSFHSDARKVHGIGDVAGIALTGLAEQRGAVDPHPRGLSAMSVSPMRARCWASAARSRSTSVARISATSASSPERNRRPAPGPGREIRLSQIVAI